MGYQVLYIEDSTTMQHVMHIALAQEECTLYATANPSEALAWAHQNTPSFAFIDTSLPHTDAAELCVQLKQIPSCKNTHVFFIGGSESPHNEASAHKAGATGFVQKPFLTHVFLDTLHAHTPATYTASVIDFPQVPSFDPISVPFQASSPPWAHTPSTALLTQEDLASLAPPDFDITEWVLEASLTTGLPEGLEREELHNIAREVIERVAWEVVPMLTENYLRQHGHTLIQQALRTKRPSL